MNHEQTVSAHANSGLVRYHLKQQLRQFGYSIVELPNGSYRLCHAANDEQAAPLLLNGYWSQEDIGNLVDRLRLKAFRRTLVSSAQGRALTADHIQRCIDLRLELDQLDSIDLRLEFIDVPDEALPAVVIHEVCSIDPPMVKVVDVSGDARGYASLDVCELFVRTLTVHPQTPYRYLDRVPDLEEGVDDIDGDDPIETILPQRD